MLVELCVYMRLCSSSARFDGSMNVDLNEITMNLVPFPRLHYLVASQTPLFASADVKVQPRRFVFSPLGQSIVITSARSVKTYE